MKEDLKSETRELEYALETADQIVRGSGDWLFLLDESEKSALVRRMREVSVLIRRTERAVEIDPTEAVLFAGDLVVALTICGEGISDSPDHAVADLFGDAAEQVRDASATLAEAVAR